jgi:hypothetical protein
MLYNECILQHNMDRLWEYSVERYDSVYHDNDLHIGDEEEILVHFMREMGI